MLVTLNAVTKKFNREVIFKDLSYTFEPGKTYAITGPNGSGKSTLLQVISGYVRPTKGDITYVVENNVIDVEDAYRHLVISTPYLELIEEFTLDEMLKFHFRFKSPSMNMNEIVNRAYLQDARNKEIKKFSSGMKQRLKLALTLFTNSSLILLDEPTSNLDQQGTDWYISQMTMLQKSDKTIIIASNQSYEYDFCDNEINIKKYKP